MGQCASGCGQSESGRLRSLIATIFLAFLLACSDPGSDPAPEIPDSPDVPIFIPCIAWDGLADWWRVNIGGEEWEIADNHFYIGDLEPGLYESYIRMADGSDTALRFAIVVRSGEEPEIIFKE